MTEIEVTSFSKTYKYIDKIEDDGFTIRYRINLDVKIAQQPKNIKTHDTVQTKPIKKEEVQEDIKEKVVTAKGNTDKKERKIDMTRKELEELRKYQKVNMKTINVVEDDREEQDELNLIPQPKKKKYSKANRQGQEKYNNKSEKKEHRNRIQSEDKNQQAYHNHQPTFEYNDYLSLDEILKSCQLGEHKYFKGRVEYGEGPKSKGKIVSDQIDGVLIIEGKHRNRTIHDDQVYFSIIHKEDDRINCTVHYIIPIKRVVVGKVSIIQSKGIYVLTPINSRIAAMNAKPENVPKNITKSMKTHYFMGQFIGWNKKDDYPYCNIIKQFGKFGDIDVETQSLLKIHNLEDKDYDNDIIKDDLQQFLKTVDEKGQYIISDQQINKREDLRESRIFTIDPHNSRDFDDAISVQKVGQNFKVGVHIADASFFVPEGSKIDQQARKRTTSVYLVHRVIPMLPRLLCQNFCSLNPGRSRLTFTIWMKLDQQGKIIETPTISRSVIRSKARFTYEQAQKIIEGTIKDQSQIEEGFGCVKNEQFASIANDLLTLHELASQLRKRRVERGSLFFQIPRKVFRLDQTNNPIDFSIYERKQAHFLVEELMIIANEQIGQVLVKSIGAQSLLRRHKYPGTIKIERFQAFMKKIGMPLEISKDTRVQDTLNSVLTKQGVKQVVRDIIKYETISLLQAADYFIVGQSDPTSWIHYALNSPVYTHFTSPIRRYPDILVHRQLAAILSGKDNLKPIPKQLIDLCNEKKLQAKRVSNGCEKIFMCLHLRKAEVIAKGIICEANHWGIKVCIPRFDFKGTLRFQDINHLSVLTVENDTVDRRILKMQYNGNKKDPTKFILKELQQVEIKLSCKQGFPLDYLLTLIMPHPELIGQHLLIQ